MPTSTSREIAQNLVSQWSVKDSEGILIRLITKSIDQVREATKREDAEIVRENGKVFSSAEDKDIVHPLVEHIAQEILRGLKEDSRKA